MTIVCATTVICYVVAFGASTSCLVLQDETIDMINGWPGVLEFYSKDDDRIHLKIIDNTKTAIVVMSCAGLGTAVGFGMPIFYSFAFRAVPVGLMPAAEMLGLIPSDTRIPRILWKTLFLPLECCMYVLPMVTAGWCSMLLMLIIMVVQTCLDQMRLGIE